VGPGDPAAGLRPDCGVSGRLDGDPVTVTGWTSSLTADGYLAAVRRTLEHIAAGDIFQANITQRLSADFRGGPRRLAARALARSAAGYGAYLELPGGRHIVSMSPELFLEVVPDACGGRRVVTRPIKGTRPAGVAREELRDSPKDAAELHMIVDLMRNDLGRVCAYGSVRVPVARAIETHPTVHHGVGEVTGLLREDAGMSDLLRATFPGGSVTGAPKIRAMQIIEDLEPVPRGPYCGSIGFFSDTGAACLSIAIRTILLTAGDRGGGGRPVRLDYSVGGGVVADSVPGAEYDESLAKAAVLKVVLEDGTRPRSGSLLLRASL
jgi:para-aminobenzoate synthetase component 1